MASVIHCTREGCPQKAVYQAGLRAWAQGYPKTPENCAEVLFTLYTCVAHSQEIMDLEYMSEPVWQSVRIRFMLANKVPPAWGTAEGFIREIGSGKITYKSDRRAH